MKRIFSLALVLLVVTSPISGLLGVGASPVGQASATCSGMGVMVDDDCGPDNDPSNTEIDQSQDHLSLYQQGVSMMSMSQSFNDVMSNYVRDTEDIAWLTAERAVAQAYQNGSTQSAAKIDAKEAVKDYYATKQKNLLTAWDNHMAALKSMKNQTSTFTNDSTEFVYKTENHNGYQPGANYHEAWFAGFELRKKNITLINGETVKSYILDPLLQDDGTYVHMEYNPVTGLQFYDNTARSTEYVYDHTSGGFGQINIRAPPNSDYPQKAYFFKPRWDGPANNIQSTYDEVASEIDVFVDNTYNDFQTDQINVTELLSRTNLMNHYMADGSGNASFNDVVAALSAAGWSTTDLGNTSYMNLTYEPNHLSNASITRKGMLLSGEAPPNETWTVGQQYNSSEINGTQAVATLAGDLHTVNGSFQINAVYDSNGEEIEDVDITTPDRSYKTTNTTELQNLVEQLGKDIEKLEDMKTDDSGGAGAGSGVDASGFFSAFGNALTGLFGFVGSGVTGAIQGLVIVAGGLIALSILLNALMPG